MPSRITVESPIIIFRALGGKSFHLDYLITLIAFSQAIHNFVTQIGLMFVSKLIIIIRGFFFVRIGQVVKIRVV
jgi:hypothetical protein